MAADNLYPYWMMGFMGKGYGKSKQPLRAIAFTFLLSVAFILIGIVNENQLFCSN
jgi:solute carrier family 12 sodium/potassium/chloride transporter 2